MKKKSTLYGLTALILLLATCSVSLAWFFSNQQQDMNLMGAVRKSYFESGDGSSEKPFEIAHPVQLYYFSWLQNLGIFNQREEGKPFAPTYF